MLYLGFALRNPWVQKYRNVYEKVIPVTKNKSIEICIFKSSCILEFSLGITGFKQDHAGFNFDFGLLSYTFDFQFYDNRHYNERSIS